MIIAQIDSGYLRGYFEHASGPVANVNIVIKTQDSKELRVAYVTFVMPEDAAKWVFFILLILRVAKQLRTICRAATGAFVYSKRFLVLMILGTLRYCVF